MDNLLVKVGDMLKFTTAYSVGYCVVVEIDKKQDLMMVYWNNPLRTDSQAPYYEKIHGSSMHMFGRWEKLA